MAKTAFTTDNALTKKLFEEKLYRDTVKESFFSAFTGMGSNNIIETRTDFMKEKGDKITFGIRMRLTGDAVTSGNTLENNEESLTTHDYSPTLEQYRNAVRDNGKLTRQRAMFSITNESVDALKEWGAEFIDKTHYNTLNASPTKIFYGGDAVSTATIEAGDKVTPELISKIKAWAKTGGNRAQTPLRPVRIKGKKYFVLMVHEDQLYDLKQNAQWAQAAREALPRGTDNPLFSAAEFLWDGVLIAEHENVKLQTTWGTGAIAGAEALFLGAQAGVIGWGQREEVVAETFDYGNEHGYAWGIMAAFGKPVFNSLDYGVISVKTARTQISDA